MDAKKTADEIIGGRRLTREDDWQFLLDAPLEEPVSYTHLRAHET